MFDPLNGKNRKRFGMAMAVSTAVQVLLVAMLIIVPLFMTNTLSMAALADKLLIPLPPPAGKPLVEVFTPEKKEKPRETETKVNDKFTSPPETSRFIPIPEPDMPRGNPNGVPGGDPAGAPNGTSDRPRFPLSTDPGPEVAPSPPPPPPPPPPALPTRVRVGGNVQAANLLFQAKPVYPTLAKQARIQGVVVLEAEINAQGTIDNLKVISGHPLLVPAAIEAVKQWRYRPTMLNGTAVPVTTTITVNFAFAQE